MSYINEHEADANEIASVSQESESAGVDIVIGDLEAQEDFDGGERGDVDMLGDLASMQSYIDVLKSRMAEAKRRIKEIRSELELKQAEMAQAIRCLAKSAAAQGNCRGDGDAGGRGDDWQGTQLSSLDHGLPDVVLKALSNANINTLGDLAEFTMDKELERIPGIGEKHADRIRDACEKFWAVRNNSEGNQQATGGAN
jgi:ERCC4-type nuclease